MTDIAEPTRARAPARTRARTRTRARPFVAVDGESCTIAAGEHAFVLLQASTGAELFDPAGIDTRSAFTWLLRVGRESGGILVGFGWNYDVNMMLRDVPHEQLVELWTEGRATITLDSPRWGEREFVVEWIPSKLFSIATDGAAVTVYDTFGFFQQSFVNALDSWAIAAPDIIARLKAERGAFTLADIDVIREYNAEECRLLVELMEALRTALHDVGLRPRSWLGAGAIAAALLAKHDVDKHVSQRRPATVDEDVLPRAYFGGRTEVFRQGVWNERAYAWDVNSAYPAEAIELPTALGTWRKTRRYDAGEPWAIWRVRWRLRDDDAIIAPFPFRDRRSIYYPLQGEGWYHGVEVAAALEIFGDQIEVTGGYVFTPADGSRPFAFLTDVYAERQQLKAEGHAGEKVLKLGINSVYGKLAQGNTRDGRRPRFQDYFWAGRITAGTRAKVLAAAHQGHEHLVAIATDGIVYAGGEPQLVEAKGLGGWERTVYADLFVAQPGIYYAHETRQRGVVKHSRGFFTREIDFPKLRRTWLRDGPFGELECRSHRFVGLGSALMRSDFAVWRTWQSGTRRLSLYSARKYYDDGDAGQLARRLLPPAEVRAGVSDRYVPKNSTLDEADAEFVQGTEQPAIAF